LALEDPLQAPAVGADEADRLGIDPPAVRPDGQVHDGVTSRHRPAGGNPAPFHPEQHSAPNPYKGFAELGKAIKTIFLCHYLHSEALRREIHEGLNMTEQWNGANDFVFFARRGELVSNHREDHEVSMLALHLLQNCMVYINTLMLQQVLAQPHWGRKLTPRDLSALTPLIWEHVNPYGRFELDMDARRPLR
jgi:hypothetical protein